MNNNDDKFTNPILGGHQAELDAIAQSRTLRYPSAEQAAPDRVTALCLSGGGIRSATFALGVINRMAENNGHLLRQIDYLSTVSGGGYLGSFVGKMFLSYGVAENEDNNTYQRLSRADSENLHYLRRNGRYLAQNGDEGLVAIATFIRNTTWLHLLLVPMLMLVFILAFVLRQCFVTISYNQPFAWLLALKQDVPGQLLWQRIPYDWLLGLTLFGLFLLTIPLYFLLSANSKPVLRHIARWQGALLGASLLIAMLALLCDVSLYLYHTADSSWLSAVAAFVSALVLFTFKVFPLLNKLTERFRSASFVSGAIAVVVLLVYFSLTGISAIALFEHFSLWQPRHFLYFLSLTLLLALLSCKYDFINRTTLHAFYSARLRRAYLGAANRQRFKSASSADNTPLVEFSDNDDGALTTYCPHSAGGPVHLINVTVNCKLSPNSQLWQPDRQGANLAVSALSASAGNNIFCQNSALSPTFTRKALTLAQWVAISGAAASTGMGRLTSWYSSIITALLNVRLGYWWKPKTSLTERFYRCFYAELSNRYYANINSIEGVAESWYLSDGGHFENLAVYEMIKRRVTRIMLLDAGQDKHFTFDDLANLVRRARIDFHYDFTVATQTERATVFPQPQLLALLGDLAELKSNADQLATKRACLIKGHYTGCGTAASHTNPDIYLLYIKPTLTGSESIDIRQYRADYPDYPHESTADQFFDEAQWESYRKLGYHSADELNQLIQTFLS